MDAFYAFYVIAREGLVMEIRKVINTDTGSRYLIVTVGKIGSQRGHRWVSREEFDEIPSTMSVLRME
jgi:hypothetical protein